MPIRLIAALLLLTFMVGEARAQGGAPPGLTRHGNWAEGRVTNGGREACIAGTPVPGRGSFQATVGRNPDGSVVLVLAVRMEGATFTEDGPIRFAVDGTNFELPGQAARGQPVMVVAASTEEEARRMSDLLVAMRRGRAMRVQIGTRPALEVSLTGASPALGGMRSCAQRAGMMPR